jgi:CO dehydrogenase maturation factor
LNEVLGVEADQTVGGVREDVLANINLIPAGMTKEAFIELRLQEAIIETKNFDLMVMGRPEGPGCYCYANSLLRKYIDLLSDNYKYVVIDNEAGMEHLSRRTTRDIDLMFIVSDAAPVGIDTAKRISNLVDELKLKVKEKYLVLSRVNGELHPALQKRIDESGLKLAGIIPADEKIVQLSYDNKPIVDLEDETPAIIAADKILKQFVG